MELLSKIRLRTIQAEDIPALLEIEKSATSKTYSAMATEEEWQKEMAKTNAIIYTILKNGEIVGDVSYEIKNEDTAYISGLCVSSKFRRQRIGSEAIRLILEELKDKKRIELVTHPENINAIKLYKSLGFEQAGEPIENYFGDGEPRIRMIKTQNL